MSQTDQLFARADLTALFPHYDSQAEAWWAAYGAAIIASELRTPIALTQHHALSFHLPGGSYTPDFLHILQDGRLVLVEVKVSKQQKNYRDARSKLRAAATLYAWVAWYEARVANGNFELELIAGDK